MLNTSIIYVGAGLIRFIFAIYVSLRTVQLLSIEEYAYFGIANVIAMLFGLLWFINIDSSFQKLFSKRLISKSVNFLVLMVTFFLTITMMIFTELILIYFKNTNQTFGALEVVETNYSLYYFLFISLNSYILSILNAKRKKKEYVLQLTLPVILVALYLFLSNDIELSKLFLVHASSIGLVTILIGSFNPSILKSSNYSARRFKFILMYMIRYTYRSIPTLTTKYLLDLVIRATIIKKFGHQELAAYNFCQSLLNIFRSFEQSIARAVTPFILKQTKSNNSGLNFARNLIFTQTVITIITLFSSYIWMPMLMEIIASKPADVFDSEMLILLGAILIAGYWKNYSLMYMKKFSRTIKIFYDQTTFINLLLMLVFSLAFENLYVLLIIQLNVLVFHNFVLQRNIRKFRTS